MCVCALDENTRSCFMYAGDEKPFMNNPTLSALYAEDYIPDAN